MKKSAPIGIFDSGYGGLTVFKAIEELLPAYDYLYLGDNARTPYGNRSFASVYQYTRQCVAWLFAQGCPLVVLACNTASAKALRTIQQMDLPTMAPQNRVLGVIRPTTELLGSYSETGSVGILATSGTVASQSYPTELKHFFPDLKVYQQACPMWVPLVENNEMEGKGAEYFIKKDLHSLFAQGENIDVVLLACTHFPLLMKAIQENLPVTVKLLTQGKIVADSLQDYLFRHQDMEQRISKNFGRQFYTTEDAAMFSEKAALFYGKPVVAEKVEIG